MDNDGIIVFNLLLFPSQFETLESINVTVDGINISTSALHRRPKCLGFSSRKAQSDLLGVAVFL